MVKIRSQIGMVLNLDKCIGCHTCSITCKTWTSREGMEYAWFNNVETKPGIGYPKEWENQDKWNGGWVRNKDGSINPKLVVNTACWRIYSPTLTCLKLMIITNPFDFDYQNLHTAPEQKHQPVARPRSLISGKRMQKIEGVRTGKKSWVRSFPNAAKIRTLIISRRKFTASRKYLHDVSATLM